jgi:hypothetical protein
MTDTTASPAAPAAAFMEAQAQEALSVWTCACEAWSDYMAAVAASPTPAGLLQANAKLAADTLSIYGRAAGVMLAHHGLRAPLLCDA